MNAEPPSEQALQEEIQAAYEEINELLDEGNSRRAIARATELQALVRLHLGDQGPEYLEVLDLLGSLQRSIPDYPEAARYYRQAIDLSRRLHLESSADHAGLLGNLALVLKTQQVELDEAEQLYREAHDILLDTVGEEDPTYVGCLNNLAELYRAMGRYEEAIPFYEQAIRIGLTRTLGLGHPIVSAMLGNFGLLQQAMGNFEEAQVLLMLSAEEYHDYYADQGSADHPDVARSLNNLGMLYHELGNYADAENYYLESLRIRREVLGPANLDTAQSANNLGSLYAEQGLYDRAEGLLQFALDVRRRFLGGQHPLVAESVNNLGTLYFFARRYGEAESLLSTALDLYRGALGEAHPDLVGSLDNVAAVQLAKGRAVDAERTLREALQVVGLTAGHHRNHAGTLGLLARAVEVQGRPDEALELMHQAIAIDDNTIQLHSAVGSVHQRAALIASMQFRLDELLSLVVTFFPGSRAAVGSALDTVLRRKGLGLLLEVALRRLASSQGDDVPKYTLRDLREGRRATATTTLAGPAAGESLDQFERRLHEGRGVRQLQETALAVELHGVPLATTLAAAGRAAIANALSPGTALVEFVRGATLGQAGLGQNALDAERPPHYLAFVMGWQAPDHVQLVDLGDASAIDRQIAVVRAAITGEEDRSTLDEPIPDAQDDAEADPAAERRRAIVEAARDFGALAGPREGSDAAAAELRAAIFDPLLDALGGVTRLVLAPDGALVRLPFEILPLPDGRRLIERYAISYVTVGRDLLDTYRAAQAEPGAPVVIADPDFDAGTPGPQGGRPFGRLEGTRVEGELVGRRLDVRPLTGAAALESAVTTLASPHVLHLATHGVFLPDDVGIDRGATGIEEGPASAGWLGRLSGPYVRDPLLRSILALAGANTWLQGGTPPQGAEDGLLTAEDIAVMDLEQTELVVMSACQTGLGSVQVGEGVFGLRRAVTLAGADTLVMSLWKVPDAQTQELMVAFYERLMAGEGRAEALRQAQLEVKARFSDPFYWGAFICQGATGPLSTRMRRSHATTE